MSYFTTTSFDKNPQGEKITAIMSYPSLNNRQPDTPYEYLLTEMVGNYIIDDSGSICYGNISDTYRLLEKYDGNKIREKMYISNFFIHD